MRPLGLDPSSINPTLHRQAMLKLSKDYNERVQEEEGKTVEELIVANVGKIDPKRHLESDVASLMSSNVVQCLGAMLDTIVF